VSKRINANRQLGYAVFRMKTEHKT